MKVSQLMTPEVITVGRDASLKEAARRMIEAGVSGLVVTDAEGSLQGVITEADFVKTESQRRSGKRARLLRWLNREEPAMPDTERLVGNVMTSDVITLDVGADHAEAARLMRKAGVKRIPIVDENGRLVGILSRSDILRAFARPDRDIVDEIEEHVMRDVLWIDPRRVSIQCIDGNLVLNGRLETRGDVTLLEALACRVDGVVSMASHLAWDIDNTKLEMVPPPPGLPHRTNWS
jgi:CBS domain-containing protein